MTEPTEPTPSDLRAMIDAELAALQAEEGPGDLADALAAQAVELWAHLPAAEVAGDEKLHFRTDSDGCLVVHAAATGITYRLRDGAAWKVSLLPDGQVAVECWRDGALVDSAVAGADATGGTDPRWN